MTTLPKIRWSPERVALLSDLLGKGLTRQACADVMGLRKHQVAGAIGTYGIGPSGSQHLTRAAFMEAVTAVCALTNVHHRDLLGMRRLRPMVYARQHVMWLLRGRGYSFPQIAERFGMHHTSVMWGVAQHEKRLAEAAVADAKVWNRIGTVHREAVSVHRFPAANTGTLAA